MSYERLAELVQRHVEEYVSIGVSREVIEQEMKGVEWAALLNLKETHRDNQLLLTLERYGTAATAQRYGKSPRTITNWRTAAINRKSRCRTVADKAGTI